VRELGGDRASGVTFWYQAGFICKPGTFARTQNSPRLYILIFHHVFPVLVPRELVRSSPEAYLPAKMNFFLLPALLLQGVLAAPPPAPATGVWQPAVGARFQIVIDNTYLKIDGNKPLQPQNAEIFDVDLFHTPKEVIAKLHEQGKKVICYFSAGGSESWRPDDKEFKAKDRGDTMREWKGEKWLDIRSPDVWTVMEKRIKLAADKGCDGIDPDNLGTAFFLVILNIWLTQIRCL
jgi:hypothetical protein